MILSVEDSFLAILSYLPPRVAPPQDVLGEASEEADQASLRTAVVIAALIVEQGRVPERMGSRKNFSGWEECRVGLQTKNRPDSYESGRERI